MKKILLITLQLLFLLLTTLSVNPAMAEPLDGIVAVVNDDIITTAELNTAVASLKSQVKQNHIAMPDQKILQRKALELLIDKRLQFQLAKQGNIQVNDEELDKIVAHIAKQNNVSVASLYQHVQQQGLSKQAYRNELRDQVILQKLQQQEVSTGINITPQEIDHFMKSQPWQNAGTKEYRLQDILVPLSDTPSTEAVTKARQQAERIIAKLKKGQNFEEAALNESGDKNAAKGGDLGFRKLPEIPSAFVDHITQLKPKEIAGPIQTPNGFHIVRLLAVRTIGSSNPGLNRSQIERLLLQRKFEEAVQNWISKLRSQAYIVNNLK